MITCPSRPTFAVKIFPISICLFLKGETLAGVDLHSLWAELMEMSNCSLLWEALGLILALVLSGLLYPWIVACLSPAGTSAHVRSINSVWGPGLIN